MNCTTLIHGDIGVLRLEGQFTVEHQQDFRMETLRLLEDPKLTEMHIDMRDLNHLDSNALGMLLLLREKLRPRNIAIRLVNPSPAIHEILDGVRFGKLFTILHLPTAVQLPRKGGPPARFAHDIPPLTPRLSSRKQ